MNIQIALSSVEKLVKQRNLFLLLTISLAIISSCLSLKLVSQEERIIILPPISSEVMISNKRVSSSYLEQMTLVFLNNLLDLSTADILYKRDMILKYTSHSDAGFVKELTEYFASNASKYKDFDLVTYFTVKNMEIKEQENSVIANGILTSRYGKRGYETKAASYYLSYEYSGGYLRLKEFKQVVEEEQKNKEQV